MKKNIFSIAAALLIAVSALSSVSCTKEFQVEESQLYGTWYFPLNLAPDTATGFNWAGAEMIIKNNDTLVVNPEGKSFRWTLRDNNVTAICQPRANVDESWIIAFTVYDATSSSLQIKGKYRYNYQGDNMVRGDISCTLSKTNPMGGK